MKRGQLQARDLPHRISLRLDVPRSRSVPTQRSGNDIAATSPW